MSILVLYYIIGILAGLAASAAAGWQILKGMRNKWLEEGSQAKAIQDNARATTDNTAAINKLSDKFEVFAEKLIDHDVRLHWMEMVMPADKRPPGWLKRTTDES